MPVLHSRHPQGTLELELGDWMDNRRCGIQKCIIYVSVLLPFFLGCPGYFGKKKRGGLFSAFISVGCFLTVDKKVDHLYDKHRHRWMFIHF